MTDGACVWRGPLAYYVRHDGVGVPAEFLAHMAARAYVPPRRTRQQLAAIVDEAFGAEPWE